MGLVDIVNLFAWQVRFFKKKRRTGEELLQTNLQAALDGATDNIWNYESYVDKSGVDWDWSPALEAWQANNAKLVTVSSGNYLAGGLFVPAGNYGLSRTFSFSNQTTSGASTFMSGCTIAGEGQQNTQFFQLSTSTMTNPMHFFDCRGRLTGFTLRGRSLANSSGIKFGKANEYKPATLFSVKDVRIQGFAYCLHIEHLFDSKFDQVHLTLWTKYALYVSPHATDNSNYLMFDRLHVETVDNSAALTPTTAIKIQGGSTATTKHQNIQFNTLHCETVNWNCTMVDISYAVDVIFVNPALNRNRGSTDGTDPSVAAIGVQLEAVNNVSFVGGKIQHLRFDAANVSPLFKLKGTVSGLCFNNHYFSTGNTAKGTIASAFDVTECATGMDEVFFNNCRLNNYVTIPTFTNRTQLAQVGAVNRRSVKELAQLTRGGSTLNVEQHKFGTDNDLTVKPTTQIEYYSSGCVKVAGGFLGASLTVPAGSTAVYNAPQGVQNGRGMYIVQTESNDNQGFCQFRNVPGQAPVPVMVGTSFNLSRVESGAVADKVNVYQSGNGLVIDNRTAAQVVVSVVLLAG